MPRNVQITRLLKLARVLADAKRGLPLQTIATRYGWNRRTLYRDVEVLSEAGFRVIKDEDRFRIERDSFFAAADRLQPDERLALFAAKQLAGGLRETSTGRALDKLWKRLAGPTGKAPPLLPLDEETGPTLRSPFAIDYGPHRQKIETIEEAIADRRPLRCSYHALSSGEQTTRTIEPGALHWDPALESLYLIAWCRLRESVRVFAVHRFALVALEPGHFAPRRECRSQTALASAFRVWRSGSVEKVVVRLSGWAAREAQERKLHPSQSVEALLGGDVRVTLTVSGLEEVSRWLLGYGTLAVAESPPTLVARIASELRATAAAYPQKALTQADNELPQTGDTRARRKASER